MARKSMGIKPLREGYSQPKGPAGSHGPVGGRSSSKGGVSTPPNSRGSTSKSARRGRNF